MQLSEAVESDKYIVLRAGYCTPVTGSDHPFNEELIEREPENVRALVGEIIYDVEK